MGPSMWGPAGVGGFGVLQGRGPCPSSSHGSVAVVWDVALHRHTRPGSVPRVCPDVRGSCAVGSGHGQTRQQLCVLGTLSERLHVLPRPAPLPPWAQTPRVSRTHSCTRSKTAFPSRPLEAKWGRVSFGDGMKGRFCVRPGLPATAICCPGHFRLPSLCPVGSTAGASAATLGHEVALGMQAVHGGWGGADGRSLRTVMPPG